MRSLARQFFELPSRLRINLASASIVVLLLLGYLVVLAPRYAEHRALRARQGDLSLRKIAEERIARGIPGQTQEIAKLEEKLEAALQPFPEEQDIPGLLKSVADGARDVGLEVILLRPEREEQQELLVELPVLMSVEGTFHQMVSFFDALGRMPRVMNIRALDISDPRSVAQGTIVKADFSVVTFRRPTAVERDSKKGRAKEG
jgi:type IV pilus assembly protein PilO